MCCDKKRLGGSVSYSGGTVIRLAGTTRYIGLASSKQETGVDGASGLALIIGHETEKGDEGFHGL
jgi:hypothetical protein